jgi:MFS family permease
MYLLTPDYPYGTLAFFQCLFGLGIGMIFSVSIPVLQNSAPQHEMAITMSCLSFFQNMGGAIGVSILGAVLNAKTADYLAMGQSRTLAVCNALDIVFLGASFAGAAAFFFALEVHDVEMPKKKVEVTVPDVTALERATPPSAVTLLVAAGEADELLVVTNSKAP